MTTPPPYRLEPWERLMLLSNAVDELGDGPEARSMRTVVRASMAVVRQVQGKITRHEAEFTLDLAFRDINEARKR